MKRPQNGPASTKKRPRPRPPPFEPPVDTLPVLEHSKRILSSIASHDVLILVSETGSGKTTQLPQLLLKAHPSANIVITQPRRVAAVSVANRVADEAGCAIGEKVGYAVRFDEKSRPGVTKLRYVTDGVLLRESMSARALYDTYDFIVVDEVHERSVNTDVILGVVKRALLDARKEGKEGKEGPPMKLVVMSATTDAEKLAKFFAARGGLKVATERIAGRLFPVRSMYAAEPVQDFVDGAVTAALQVHVDYAMDGDVLVFLPGQDEIMSAVGLMKERVKRYLPAKESRSVLSLPLFASLPAEEQARAVNGLDGALRGKVRKVIFSTNVAETSLTIPGVKYVVDSGMAKVRTLLSVRGMQADVLRLESISRAQAEQRKGRAGRMSAGIVFRLYTEVQHKAMAEYPVPEVLRVDAASTVLQIIAYDAAASGPGLLKFPRLDSPPKKLLLHALETLVALGALDDEMHLTKIGELMARMPVAPMLARSLLESARLGCTEDMVVLAAILSVEGGVFFAPVTARDAARAAHRRFLSRAGDHLTLVNVYRAFAEEQGRAKRAAFCKDHFLNMRTLLSAESIVEQISRLMDAADIVDWSLAYPATAVMEVDDADSQELLQRCVVAGFFRNAARRREEDGKYVLVGAGGVNTSLDVAGTGADVHPASVLSTGSAKRGPPLVVFNELVLTSKTYLRTVLSVEQSWLTAHSGIDSQFYKSSTSV